MGTLSPLSRDWAVKQSSVRRQTTATVEWPELSKRQSIRRFSQNSHDKRLLRASQEALSPRISSMLSLARVAGSPCRDLLMCKAVARSGQLTTGRQQGTIVFSWSDETIYTSSPDAVAGAARKFASFMASEGTPPWCQLVFGSDDMSSAYRQVPNCPEEARAWSLPGGMFRRVLSCMRYSTVHPYGLATAVVNFCRIPALTTAVCRRFFATAAVSYFDDTGTLDTAAAAGSGQEGVALVHSLCGFRLDPGKQQPMAIQRLFLGVLLDFSRMREDGLLLIDLKPGAREQLAAEAMALLEQGRCSPAQAAKLRGKFSWSSSAVSEK